MAVTAAPARPVTDLRDRVVRRAEVVGVWAVDCVCAHRADTDWAAELLGDKEHRHEHATLDARGLPRRLLRRGARRAPARDGLRAARLRGHRSGPRACTPRSRRGRCAASSRS